MDNVRGIGVPRRPVPPLGPALLLVVAVVAVGASPASPATLRAKLEDGMVAALVNGKQLFVEAPPRRGEGVLKFASRLCGSSKMASCQLVLSEVFIAQNPARFNLCGAFFSTKAENKLQMQFPDRH